MNKIRDKDQVLTIRIEGRLMRRLKKICDQLYGVAVSKFVRKAIEEKINREEIRLKE